MNPSMLPRVGVFLMLLSGTGELAAEDRPWQTLNDTTVAELARNFSSPPSVYSSQITWGWNGVITRESIARDLDKIRSLNLMSAWVEPGRNREAPYLSPAFFENVRIGVEEAKKRGMHLWFDDDGGYPSGFAGGKFTLERPDLTMKALASTEQIPVEAGATFTHPLDEGTICALAVNVDTGAAELIPASSGQVAWTAPNTGRWAVALPKWVFRSGVTRSANNKSGAKDREHALMDFLNPEAGRLFINWTFEAYKKAVGDEFGKTVLGFRGDEASFGFNPWTPNFPAEFQARKGYDVRPYLAAISAIQIGRVGRGAPAASESVNLDAAHRAFADYCDVWSDLFGRNFFSAGANWCAANQLEMQVHIEHEEILPALAIADGDFFNCMRDIAVPGIDVIWHQVWHDVVADFPKLASSAAHLGGHPKAMSESFAAMSGVYPTPNLEEVGWILNHQIALGINHFEFMFFRSSASGPPEAPGRSGRPGASSRKDASPGDPSQPPRALARGVAPAGYRYLNDPKFPALAAYTNRTTYVLAQGRPAAQVGVYVPSSSFWFGDNAANRSFLGIVHALLEHQHDVDFVDEYALSTSMALKGGEFVNRSGQGYRAIVVPPVVAISQAALDRLEAFAAAGGKVVFIGGPPKLVMKRNFLTGAPAGGLGWAVVEPTRGVTAGVLAALPESDVTPDKAAPGLKYNHRRLKDGDAYFFFNEGDSAIHLNVTAVASATANRAQVFDGATGLVETLDGSLVSRGRATLPLNLESWETKLVVVGAAAQN